MRIGIDLGGTKIEAMAFDSANRELARRRVPTPHDSYEETIDCIVGLVRWLERETGTRGSVGIGTPGAISPATGLIKNANFTRLIGHPLDRDLADLLKRPIRVANDANCFAVSEAVDGAAAGAEIVFGAILGTGCGGGIALNGRVLTGANAIAGEWGHNQLPEPRDDERPGLACYCGRSGCIETFISGTGFGQDHERVTGVKLSPADIVARADAGDAECQSSLDRYIDRLARSLGMIVNVIDPAVIVLGGGMSKAAQLYEKVPRVWAPYIFSDSIATQLRPPVHGDASGVRGAAWLWDEGEGLG